MTVVRVAPAKTGSLLLAFAVAGFVAGVFVYINLAFWGFSGAPWTFDTVFVIALPLAWVVGVILAIVHLRRQPPTLRVGVSFLVALIALLIADATVILPRFV